jgi:hypothetical protein
MTYNSEYFDRIRGQINIPLLAIKHVIVVGVGTVGSPVAEHLARDGVGQFLFIDGDTYEEVNRVRHVLPSNYLGQNKAEAMASYLRSEKIPGLRVYALPQYVDDSMPDDMLDRILNPADLIIAGTGEREVQRRLGERALALDIPAIFPMLYLDGGGEVFLQTSPQSPCFFCMDGFRRGGEPVRGAEALGIEAMPVIQTAIELSLGVLDPNSRYDELTRPGPRDSDRRERQHFLLLPGAARRAVAIDQRENCPSCAVGSSPIDAEARQAWETAQRTRAARVPTAPSRPPPPRPVHPAARRASSADPSELFVSGLCVLAWWFFFSEGFNGFAAWWNPLAWIPVVGWFFYAFTAR